MCVILFGMCYEVFIIECLIVCDGVVIGRECVIEFDGQCFVCVVVGIVDGCKVQVVEVVVVFVQVEVGIFGQVGRMFDVLYVFGQYRCGIQEVCIGCEEVIDLGGVFDVFDGNDGISVGGSCQWIFGQQQ